MFGSVSFLRGPKSNARRRCVTFLGLVIINLPAGVPWYYGNLSSYTTSYLIAKYGADAKPRDSVLTSALMLTWSGGLVLANIVTKKTGPKFSMALAILLFNGSISVSYFTAKDSFTALVFSLGVLGGLTLGLLQANCLSYIIMWTTGKDLGLVSALVTQTALGAMAINQLITWYINPQNLCPDVTLLESRYFSQPDIIKRVPTVFLVMGSIFLVVQFLGLILLINPLPDKEELDASKKCLTENPENSENVERSLQSLATLKLEPVDHEEGFEQKHSNENGQTDAIELVPEKEGSLKKDENDRTMEVYKDIMEITVEKETSYTNTGHNSSRTEKPEEYLRLLNDKDSTTKDRTHSASYTDEKAVVLDMEATDERANKSHAFSFCHRDLKPSQVLKTKEFYTLWFIMLCGEYTLVIMVTYYKIFGQTHINDDHFLGTLGTTITLCLVLGRIMWGSISDKAGIKTTFLILFAIGAIFNSFLYLSIFLNKWLYFFWCCLVFNLANGVYGLFTVAFFRLFGGSHFTTNVGLGYTSCIMVNIVTPWIIQLLFNQCGWFGVFSSVVVLQIICLVLGMLFFPHGV